MPRTPVNLQSLASMGVYTLAHQQIRDISPLMLDANGELKVVTAAVLAETTREERALFGQRHGIYSFPTMELVEALKRFIGNRPAIEIGAGTGTLAKALGIPATDSWQQAQPEMVQLYASLGQKTVSYGAHVEKLDAAAAIARHRPEVVIGCWVTHRYDERRHEAGGNVDGIDEEMVLKSCHHYVLVGNEKVHANKSIWGRPHYKAHPSWLYSRAINGTPEFVAVWGAPPNPAWLEPGAPGAS